MYRYFESDSDAPFIEGETIEKLEELLQRTVDRIEELKERERERERKPVFSFDLEYDGTLSTESAVFQALGAASACWSNLMGAGEFESTHCHDVGKILLALIEEREQAAVSAAFTSGYQTAKKVLLDKGGAPEGWNEESASVLSVPGFKQ